MSSIDKLLIQGVRSYSPSNHCVIEFQAPLTLIVGSNGCGKTTIIEALRYMTTGEMPPGSKGGAFVHDPNVLGEREVKARIKLKFRDVGGQITVATRALQSTQKPTKLETKTLEGVMQRIDADTGEKVSMSTRCAQMDLQMVTALGVSKAVLSHVIFCHQEESNWPLSEGKALKQKFDDIFAATRYIKALEAIKKFRLEQSHTIKEIEIELKHLKEKKEKATEIRMNKKRTRKQIRDQDERIEALEDQLAPVLEQMRNVGELVEQLNALQLEQATLESTRMAVEESNQALKASMTKEYTESDEALHRRQQEFGTKLREKKANLAESEQQWASSEKRLRDMQKKLDSWRSEHGALTNAAEEHSNNREKRDSVVHNMSQKHNIKGYEQRALSSAEVAKFSEVMQRKATKANEAVDHLREQYRAQDKKFQARVDDCKSKYARITEAVKHKTEAQCTAVRRLKEVRGKVAKLKKPDEDSARELEQRLAEAQKASAAAKAAYEAEVRSTDLPALEKKKADLAYDARAAKQRLQKLAQTVEARAQFGALRQQLQNKQGKQAELLADQAKCGQIDMIFGFVPKENILSAYRNKLAEVKGSHTPAAAKLRALEKELSSVQSKRQVVHEQLETAEEQAATLHGQLKDATGDSDFEHAIKSAAAEKDKCRQHLSLLRGLARVYERMKQKAESSKCCPVCARGLEDETAFLAAMRACDEKLNGIPEQRQAHELVLKQKKQSLETLEAVRPIANELKRLQTNQCPQLRKRLAAIKQEVVAKKSEVEMAATAVDMAKQELEEIEALRPFFEHLDRLASEISGLQKRVDREAAKLGVAGQNPESMQDINRELSRVTSELDMVSQKLDDAKHQRDSLQASANTNARIVSECEKDLMEWRLSSEQLTNLRRQETELVGEEARLKNAVAELEREQKPLQTKMDRAKADQATAEREFQEQLQKKQSAVDKLARDLDAIANTQRVIDRFEKSGKKEKLAKVSELIGDAQQKQKESLQRSSTLKEAIDTLKYELSNQQTIERDIQDNMTYRENLRQIATLEAQEADIEKKLQQMDRHPALNDQKVLQEKIDECRRKKASAEGEKKILEDQVREYERELRSKMYKNAEDTHRQKLIEHQTTKIANDDLDKYYAALDRAIMKYHSMKMEEINKIIKELWVQTYQGNDIDYVEIRSDAEDDKAKAKKPTTGTKRKTYHYRVVMVKGDCALDMRGRCSAGQKVLASIIIRLALAETFCVNCGILALDEPTTNLDRENVQSLAHALTNIIKAREKQSNFQLIVITHDEEFVSWLGRGDVADHYFRVSKDADSFSQITKQRIEDLA